MQSNAKRRQTVSDVFWPGGAHTTNSLNKNYYCKTMKCTQHLNYMEALHATASNFLAFVYSYKMAEPIELALVTQATLKLSHHYMVDPMLWKSYVLTAIFASHHRQYQPSVTDTSCSYNYMMYDNKTDQRMFQWRTSRVERWWPVIPCWWTSWAEMEWCAGTQCSWTGAHDVVLPTSTQHRTTVTHRAL